MNQMAYDWLMDERVNELVNKNCIVLYYIVFYCIFVYSNVGYLLELSVIPELSFQPSGDKQKYEHKTTHH